MFYHFLASVCVQVNNDLLWEDIQEEFKVPVACTNGSQALKYIYFRSVELNVFTVVSVYQDCEVVTTKEGSFQRLTLTFCSLLGFLLVLCADFGVVK